MEPQRIITKFLHLPPAAQRVVAELVEYLDRDRRVVEVASVSDGAILLPPIDISQVPTTWPENEFADPTFFGVWADRSDIVDSTEFVRELRRTQWGASE